MQKLSFINSLGKKIDFTDGVNFGVIQWKGLSEVDTDLQTQTSPFQDGSVYLDSVLANRDLSFTVALNDGGNLKNRYQKKEFATSVLNPKLGEGILFYKNDFLEKRITVVPETPVFPTKNMNDPGTLHFDVSFIACDPYWQNIDDTVVRGDFNSEVPVNNPGDVPCNIIIEIPGGKNIKNPQIINATNGKKLKYEGTLTDYLEINTNYGKKSCMTERLNFNLSVGGDFTDITYGNGMFVAVGAESNILTSSDGINWVSQSSNVFANFVSIAYGNGMFVITGVNITTLESFILSSPDGESWTETRYIEDGQFPSVTFFEKTNRFVAVCQNFSAETSFFLTSSDGINWAQTYSFIREIAPAGGFVTSAEKIIYFGTYLGKWDPQTGSWSMEPASFILTSLDGLSWTETYYDNTGFYFSSNAEIATNSTGKKYMALMSKAHELDPGYDYFILSSPDGENWVMDAIDFSVGSMTFNPTYECVIAVTRSRENYRVSYDYGTSWTERSFGDDGANVRLVVKWQNDMTFIIGSIGYLSYSLDLDKWFKSKFCKSGLVSDISCGNGIFVAVGVNTTSDEGFILTSSDGINWSSRSSDVFAFVTFNSDEKYFCALKRDGDIATSEDGINWNVRGHIDGVNFSGYEYFAHEILFKYISSPSHQGYYLNLNDKIYHAVTENNWQAFDTPNQNGFSDWVCIYDGVHSDSDRIVAVRNGAVYRSPLDSISSWELMYNNPHYTGRNSIAFSPSNGSIVTVGAVSPDGINWTEGSLSGIVVFFFSEKENSFFAVPNERFILTSSDGLSWNQSNTDPHCYAPIKMIYSEQVNKYMILSMGLMANSSSVYVSDFSGIENTIDKISGDSDMNFTLEPGENNIRFLSANASGSATIRFNPKTIGV